MDIGSLFLILAILIPVVIFIGRPLMERRSTPQEVEEQDLSSLLARRDQVIAAIQELDDDYQLGKIPAESYPGQRSLLLQGGAGILRQLDAFQETPSRSTAEDQMEAAISAHRLNHHAVQVAGRKNGNSVPPVPDDELEQRIAIRRRLRQGKAGGFCPKCGRPVQAADRFCPRCGAQLV
ncbi:MAG: zinc ribbon domain-containing protein [Acidobacteriaceae bacterium]